MTNKVRAGALGLAVDEPAAVGAQLYMVTRGTAAIRDDSQPLRSKRYIATMTLQAEGWILAVNAGGLFGPFPSPETAFMWWADHRHAMPASAWTSWRREAWPPGIEEDWAEHGEP